MKYKIGDYVSGNREEVCQVSEISKEKTTAWSISSPYGTDHPAPIPLTKEWLIKLGMSVCHNKTIMGERGYSLINKKPNKNLYIRTYVPKMDKEFFALFNHSNCNGSKLQFIRELEYVHELQQAINFLT